jgi:hypothetical protein
VTPPLLVLLGCRSINKQQLPACLHWQLLQVCAGGGELWDRRLLLASLSAAAYSWLHPCQDDGCSCIDAVAMCCCCCCCCHGACCCVQLLLSHSLPPHLMVRVS